MIKLDDTKNEIQNFIFTDEVTVIDNPTATTKNFKKMIWNATKNVALHYGNAETKVVSPKVFDFVEGEITKKKVSFTKKIYAINEHSTQAVFTIQRAEVKANGEHVKGIEARPGDVMEAAIIVNSSLDLSAENNMETAITRLVCGNGLRRTEQGKSWNAELINVALANLAAAQEWINQMTQKKFKWSEIQNKAFSENIIKTGFAKTLIENAHEYLAIEAEQANELNAWITYNSFNKVIFEEIENSTPYKRKKTIDEKLFELLSV